MNDEELYDALARSLSGKALDTGMDTVVARGRRMRARNRMAAAGMGTCAAALVAAVGVHASAGDAPAAAHPSPRLNIAAAGFSVQAQTDGTVRIRLADFFDPKRFTAVLAEAGIPADVQVAATTGAWPAGLVPRCVPTPGVTEVDHSRALSIVGLGSDHSEVVITPSALPAGAVVSLALIQNTVKGGLNAYHWSVLSGTPGKCVVEMVAPSHV